MKRRDIIIGVVVLAGLVAVVYFFSHRSKETITQLPEPTTEERIEETFKVEIPDDVDKAELTDVTGGTSSGIATRKYENGVYTHTVLADLPDSTSGEFYEGWLVMGDKFFSTGRMRVAKGGYLLEYTSKTDYSDYNEVVITLEGTADTTPEKHVLEGNF